MEKNPSVIESPSLVAVCDRLGQLLKQSIQSQHPLPNLADVLPEPPTLLQLGDKFHLSAFERAILLLCAGLELEPNLQRLCAEAHGDTHKPYLTLRLALSILPGANWGVLSPHNPLQYWQMIEIQPNLILTQAPLKLDRRIFCYLLGELALDAHLGDFLQPLAPPSSHPPLPPAYEGFVQQLTQASLAALQAKVAPILHLAGSDGLAKFTLAAAACDRLDVHLMALSAAVLPTNPHDLMQWVRRWEREALLSHSVLLLDCDAVSWEDPSQDRAIALFLETLTTPVILSSGDRKPTLRRSLITFDLPVLPHAEQTALWQTHLGVRAVQLNGQVDRLVSQFPLSASGIQTVCLQVTQESPQLQTGTESTLPEQLWQLCRLQARPSLDDLAQRIEARATWEDLVLPDYQRQVLSDIATHLNYRTRVYQDWGFASKSDRGLGISALFYGESGTGKTMAAEVLAQMCRLDLYRIDLSTVVSKYIGETEKNLRRIFDAAEAGGVILLFDEADALFGKRTEVKDSHDRHANIEVSYLLQRMEAYQGLAILTSNLKNNLDQAFLRRLRFMLPFPFPDLAGRSEIWQRIFPRQMPTQELDYQKLGQLKVAGGNIRAIALNAAFLAAQADQPVQMSHIRQAAQREYLKLERLLTNEEVKGWEV